MEAKDKLNDNKNDGDKDHDNNEGNISVLVTYNDDGENPVIHNDIPPQTKLFRTDWNTNASPFWRQWRRISPSMLISSNRNTNRATERVHYDASPIPHNYRTSTIFKSSREIQMNFFITG